MTEYVVLKATEDRGDGVPTTWKLVGQAAAGSAEQAAKRSASEDGIYVAIPLRSFDPQRIEVQVREVLVATSLFPTTPPPAEPPPVVPPLG